MDEDRKIRFLVAPILLVASILMGAVLDQGVDSTVKALEKLNLGSIAGGSVVVLAAGYLIGTCTQLLLRLGFLIKERRCGGSRFHEFAPSYDALKLVWAQIGAPGEEPDRSSELFAGVVFDFAILKRDREGVHQWLFRRWNGFNTAANSSLALFLSLPVGCSLGVPLFYWWLPSVLVVALALGLMAYVSWWEVMDMVGFMASLKDAPKLAKEPVSNSSLDD